MINLNLPGFPSAVIAARETQDTCDLSIGYLSKERNRLKKRIAEQAKNGLWEATLQMACLGTCGILKGELEESGYTVSISRVRAGLYSLTAFWFPSDSILKLLRPSDEDEENEAPSPE